MERKPANYHDISTNLLPWKPVIHPPMKVGTFQGQGIIPPQPFQIDQRRLSFAEDKVLQCGHGKKIIIVVWDEIIRHRAAL
jgi:hypothetical protein